MRSIRLTMVAGVLVVAAPLVTDRLEDGERGGWPDGTVHRDPPARGQDRTGGQGSASPRRGPPGLRSRRSRAIGLPHAGRLENGVQLPAAGEAFVTWDPVLRRSPNRPWRRWGTDRLLRVVVRVLDSYRAAHPEASRVAVGDLSRPRGGNFGPRYGRPGHASHQNGLDVDIYYPRLDGRKRPPPSPELIDRRLAQELVDRFVRAGASKIFVGLGTGLSGPRHIVQALPLHDNHLHVRLPGGGPVLRIAPGAARRPLMSRRPDTARGVVLRP